MSEGLQLRFGAFELDEANARLLHHGTPLDLPPKAFGVLCELARTPGRLVGKDALLDAVWGHHHVSESVLKSTVSQLRAALGDDPKAPSFIETASRRGYRFIATPAADAIPVPPLPEASPALVGRTAARARLRSAWDEAGQGRRQMFWLSGEAGVGKTTLVDDLVAQLGSDVAVAVGQCVEPFGAGEPYLPVLDALAALCRRDATLPGLLRSVAPTWLMQLPWLLDETERTALQAELAGTSQDRMLREMGELLDRYTAGQPLLLVTEDLHWSDHATVRLLDHVARRRGPARLLWLGSFRPTELISEDHPLKGIRQELRAHRLAQELALEPFSEHELAAFLDRRMPGRAFDEGLVRALHAQTDGLPLFVVNLVDELIAQPERLGLLSAGHAPAVPESLAGVIEKQIARLDDELCQLLMAGSAGGMQFRTDTLAAVLQRDAGAVQAQCEHLLQRGLWLKAGPVERGPGGLPVVPCEFLHALYRQVFYQRSSPAARAGLHRRIAEVLQAERAAGRPVASAELAMHFERGLDFAAAIRHCADAADSAMAHFAPLEARHHAEHALGLLERHAPTEGRAEIELRLVTMQGLASAQLEGVASPTAIVALERARSLCEHLPPTPERTSVLNALGWVHYTRGEFAAAEDLARRVHAQGETLGDDALRISGCNLLGVALCNSGGMVDACAWLERGLALCAELPRGPAHFVVDPAMSMHANFVQPLVRRGLLEAAAEQSRMALEGGRRLRQPMALMLAHWCACMLAVSVGDLASLQPLSTELEAIVRQHGLAQGEGPQRWYRGWALVQAGDPLAGHALILEGYECHARLGMYAGCPRVLSYAGEALRLAGDRAGARRHLDEALALAERIGETMDLSEVLRLRAGLTAIEGDVAGARADLDRATAEARAIGAEGDVVLALSARCRLPDAGPADSDALTAALATLPSGFALEALTKA